MKSMSIKKTAVGLMIALAMVFGSLSGFAATANAATTTATATTATTTIINVTVDGQRVVFEGQGPVIVDGRTLVPVRGVFEHLGFTVGWNGDTRTATMTRGNDTIAMTIGSATFTTNGISHTLDVPAQIINGSTMVPIRLPLESVGYGLDWNGDTRTVVITSNGDSPNTGTTPPSTGNFTVTNPTTGATATANQNGVHLTGPVFLTQDDIQRMLPYAREPADHVAWGRTDFNTIEGADRVAEWREEIQASEFRHPDRPMTEQELQAWIERYNEQGGINTLELEMLYQINAIRIEYNLSPLILCPNLSMASRLTSQLLRDGVLFERHNDPFYGSSTRRVQLFSPATIGVTESIQHGPIRPGGSGPINGWMSSPGHRAQMLSPNMVYIGVGSGGFTAVKQVVSVL